jgi:hypothetical protein
LSFIKQAGFQNVKVINESNYPVGAVANKLKSVVSSLVSIMISAKKP